MPVNHEPTSPLSKDAYDDLRDRFKVAPDDYKRLRGELQAVRGKRNVWDTDKVLETYTKETDRMVGILDGTINERVLEDPENPEQSTEKPDSVIWLDKSARPVSWFVDAFWEQFAQPDATRPEDEFLNIDRENWFVNQGYTPTEVELLQLGPKDFDIDKVPKEKIAGIRAYFGLNAPQEGKWQDDVWDKPTRLDGKNVLIVDEVKNRGGTLFIALQLLKRAVPEATFSGVYFWNGGRYSIDGIGAGPESQQMESLPIWYDKENSLGRGIGEISLKYWNYVYAQEPTDENYRNVVASHVLSAPHHDSTTFETVDDPLAKQLQQDIASMTYDVADGKIRRLPDASRSEEEFDKILDSQGLTRRTNVQYTEKRNAEINRRLGLK